MERSVEITRRLTRNGAAIAELRLARPERGNALDEAMLRAITRACSDLAQDEALRAVLVSGEGRHFCAGADLDWMRRAGSMKPEENLHDAALLEWALSSLVALPVPVVAKTQGCAYGGGIGLLCCADIVLAETGSRFRFSEPLLGLAPAVISPYVVRAIGVRRARRRFLAAEVFDATAAVADGLVHEALAKTDIEARTEAILENVAACGPNALRECKALLDRLQNRDGLEAEALPNRRLIARLRVMPEAREGMAAFCTSRRPSWAGAPASAE